MWERKRTQTEPEEKKEKREKKKEGRSPIPEYSNRKNKIKRRKKCTMKYASRAHTSFLEEKKKPRVLRETTLFFPLDKKKKKT